MDYAARTSAFEPLGTVVANRCDFGEMLPQGQRERSADQACAEDCYATKGKWVRHGIVSASLLGSHRTAKGIVSASVE